MTDIKVGDTVRINKAYAIHVYGENRVGTEFEVKEVVRSGVSFYVTGDPGHRGVWDKYVEKVEPKDADRWRYNDHIVVYPETRDANGPGRGVTILDETPLPKIYTRWENQVYADQTRFDEEITEAARAYWAAHPLPKPACHGAKDGELWEITTIGHYESVPAFVVGGRFYMKSAYGAGRLDSIEIEKVMIARRIYPEPEA